MQAFANKLNLPMHNFNSRFFSFILISIIYFAFFLFSPLQAQKKAEYGIRQRDRLEALSSELRAMQRNEKIKAHIYAMEKGIPIKKVFDDETIWYLEYIDQKGFPVYIADNAAEAAVTVGTDKLHPGGEIGVELEDMGIELTGEGFYAAMWETRESDTNNVETSGRIKVIEPEDNRRGSGDHATAVACNIAAAGIYPPAKGMAYKAEVHTGNTRGDWLAKMVDAASEGLLISNCSFGQRLGWTIQDGSWYWAGDPGADEDYRFGFYTSERSKPLDQMTFDAPYYLPVWSAGNFRTGDGDGTKEPNGPWDCMGPEKIAKNVLAVGNVHKIPEGYTGPEDVVLRESSSAGPSDDGRVKPDLVAPGTNILSCGLEGDYRERSGTSRSAPITAGSLLLLQQLHYEMYGGPMRAATLKGLAIHTTYPAGRNRGPDFEFGWGLLNVAGAAEVLIGDDRVNNFVKELTLEENEVYEFEFFARGNEDITATISWTDPPGEPVSPPEIDPPDLMLVNDLDIRIYDELGNVYYPWILEPDELPLDPSNPPLVATRGDNYRDNVEKLLIENPQPRKYRVEVSHKNSLENGHQDFSLILSTDGLPLDEEYLYWVGGSGNWDDPSNWSSVSGGESAGFIPDTQTTVIFDENSFEERDQAISLNSDAECYNFLWYDENMHLIDFIDDAHLEVYNSFDIQSDSLLFSDSGGVIFKGEEGQISMGDLHEGTAVFRFSNDNGSWEMISDVRIAKLIMESGSLDASQILMDVKEVFVETLEDNDVVEIDFTSSAVGGLHSFLIERGIAEIDFSGSVLEFMPGEGEEGFFTADGLDLNELVVNNGILTADGDNSFEYITSFASLVMTGSNNIGYLDLKPGSELYLKEESVQNVNAGMSIESTHDSMVLIHSTSEEPALLSVNHHKKYCFDYIHVYNVEATGEATLVAEDNSIMEGITQGWYHDSCDNVLFVEFDVQYPCEDSRTDFIDQSTGNPQSWLWHFGDPQNSQSEEQNPHFTYEEAGLYTVLLEVEGPEDTKSRGREIEIIENTIGVTRILVSEKIIYRANRDALEYQWFFDGEPISGATSRTFENEEGLTGRFNVMVIDDKCNRFSDDLLVKTSDLNQIDIYPDPFDEDIFVELVGPWMGSFMIEVVSEEGEIVFSNQYTKTSEEYLVTIPSEAYLPGEYYVSVIFEDSEYEEMIVKEKEPGLYIYPNPFEDNLNVLLIGEEMGDFLVEIVTISGKTVFSREYNKTSYEHLVTVPAAQYSSGIYVVRVKIGESRQVERAVKR